MTQAVLDNPLVQIWSYAWQALSTFMVGLANLSDPIQITGAFIVLVIVIIAAWRLFKR